MEGRCTMLPDDITPTVAFTVLTQVLDPKAEEMEMGAARFPKIVREEFSTLISLCW